MFFESWLRACGRYFNGYPWLIHRLTYRGTNHENLHVRSHNEEGRFPSKLLSAMRYGFGGHLEKSVKQGATHERS